MKTIQFAITMSAVIFLSACNKDVSTVPSPDEQKIVVTADVIQHTKAGYESGVLLPKKFVMDIVQGEDDRFNYKSVLMTRSTNGNVYSAPAGTEFLWADDTHTAIVKAMTIPFGQNTVDAEGVMEINVSLEQDTADNVAASDLLGATSEADGGIVIDDNEINIEFQHLMSKLDVKIGFASEFDENTVTINSIVLENICTAGGYSYADMDYDGTALKYGNVKMYLDKDNSTAEAIFYPYKPSENPKLVINVTIDGVEYDFTCPVVAKDAEGFIGGKRYTMNVSIVGSSVSGTDASIANGWDTDTEEESFVTE